MVVTCVRHLLRQVRPVSNRGLKVVSVIEVTLTRFMHQVPDDAQLSVVDYDLPTKAKINLRWCSPTFRTAIPTLQRSSGRTSKAIKRY